MITPYRIVPWMIFEALTCCNCKFGHCRQVENFGVILWWEDHADNEDAIVTGYRCPDLTFIGAR
jgi:hypothetical protein